MEHAGFSSCLEEGGTHLILDHASLVRWSRRVPVEILCRQSFHSLYVAVDRGSV